MSQMWIRHATQSRRICMQPSSSHVRDIRGFQQVVDSVRDDTLWNGALLLRFPSPRLLLWPLSLARLVERVCVGVCLWACVWMYVMSRYMGTCLPWASVCVWGCICGRWCICGCVSECMSWVDTCALVYDKSVYVCVGVSVGVGVHVCHE